MNLTLPKDQMIKNFDDCLALLFASTPTTPSGTTIFQLMFLVINVAVFILDTNLAFMEARNHLVGSIQVYLAILSTNYKQFCNIKRDICLLYWERVIKNLRTSE